jgi:hypothetical protein
MLIVLEFRLIINQFSLEFIFCRILATQETELQFILVTCQQEEARTGVFRLAGRAEDVKMSSDFLKTKLYRNNFSKFWRGPFRNGRSQAKGNEEIRIT